MKNILTYAFAFLILFAVACKRGGHGKCGTCPDFDRKAYKKSQKK